MGISDDAELLKIQENLISKGEQNRALSRDLARVLSACKYVAMCIESFVPVGEKNCYTALVEFIEDNQLCIGGYSRMQFLEAIKEIKTDKEEI